MDLYNRILNAQSTKGGNYVVPGNYIVELGKVFFKNDRKGVPCFIVEMNIVDSDNDERKAGTPMTWLVKCDKDAAEGNIKAFFESVLDPGEKLSPEFMKDATGEENPLMGLKMKLFAFNKDTKAGKPFTRVEWSLFKA